MRWFRWRLRRSEQWMDANGDVWFCRKGKWWRNGLSISELCTFQPSRIPPKDGEPYVVAKARIEVARITDLCPELRSSADAAEGVQ